MRLFCARFIGSVDCFCQVAVVCLPADWTQGDETIGKMEGGWGAPINEYSQYYLMDCESRERWLGWDRLEVCDSASKRKGGGGGWQCNRDDERQVVAREPIPDVGGEVTVWYGVILGLLKEEENRRWARLSVSALRRISFILFMFHIHSLRERWCVVFCKTFIYRFISLSKTGDAASG